ncbi:MAG: 50S ribosomal protein L23 [Tenericutes bacterium]|nr:MAG: 50S ribosomal protein L23 [Mycoplasmatota bacterium]
MNINEIIIKPIITEKSSADLHVNRYTFEVNKLATKTDIKRAVETIFAKSNAKVSRVNISNLKPRNKKVGRYSGRTK